jgi:hypothetical protein
VVAAWVTPCREARMQWREVSLPVALAAGAAVGGLVLANAAAWLPAVPLTAPGGRHRAGLGGRLPAIPVADRAWLTG